MSADRAVYTIKEAAELLSLSLNATYALVRAGEVPAKKLGGRWVVPKQRFHGWLNAQEDTADQEPASVLAGGAR